MRWVVDASVAAKWLVPEAESAAVDALLDGELSAPDLLYAEVANILWKKQSRGEVEPEVVSAAVRWLVQVPLQVHDGAGLLADAVQLSVHLQHPAYDCFYLCLAIRADAPLVTADRRLFERCRRADAAELSNRVVLLTAAGLAMPR